MEIEIWSDVLCPFCYIGKRKFEEALQDFSHTEEVNITWRSFQLDPDFQAGKIQGYAPYLQMRKNLSDAQVNQMLAQVTDMAGKVGLKFNFEKAVITNSHKAHQLLHYAKSVGKQNETKEALLKAHFTEGKDIGNLSTLITIAVEVGLEKSAVEKVFELDEQAEAVAKDIQEASKLGIRGVPFFVFDRKYALSGAQESSVFLDVLQKALL